MNGLIKLTPKHVPLKQQENQKHFYIKEEADFRNRISKRIESVVPPCKNT